MGLLTKNSSEPRGILEKDLLFFKYNLLANILRMFQVTLNRTRQFQAALLIAKFRNMPDSDHAFRGREISFFFSIPSRGFFNIGFARSAALRTIHLTLNLQLKRRH
jgi:hypothetical protein